MGRSRWLVGALLFVAVIGLLSVLAIAARDNRNAPIAAFTIVAPKDVSESQLVARALVPAGAPCPQVRATDADGGRKIDMAPRRAGATAAPAFATVLACSAPLPAGLTSASVAGLTIPAALPEQVDEVAIFADSGCRVDEKRIQDCNNRDTWPLEQIAERIAAEQPDVILDPGDYYYREIPCPAEDAAKCAPGPAPTPGMPFDENDQGWLYEAIEPMSPMFPVAPIAFLRGNHEDCGRAGNGFFLYLDPRDGVEDLCAPQQTPGGLKAHQPQTTPTWAFDLPITADRDLRVAMVDSAYGTDRELTDWVDKQRVSYQEADALTAPVPGRESWLLTHRPLFAVIADVNLPKDDPLAETWSSDGQMVASYGLLGNYSLLLSSHNHYLQATQIPGQAGSLIMGNGGALLDPAGDYFIPPYGPLTRADGQPLVADLAPYPNATMLWTKVEYGYAVARPAATAGGWTIDQYRFDGSPMGACDLAARSLACQ
ncbi:MAG: metallophosphoesterase [Candidatus Nanopelagicales bacterium]